MTDDNLRDAATRAPGVAILALVLMGYGVIGLAGNAFAVLGGTELDRPAVLLFTLAGSVCGLLAGWLLWNGKNAAKFAFAGLGASLLAGGFLIVGGLQLSHAPALIALVVLVALTYRFVDRHTR